MQEDSMGMQDIHGIAIADRSWRSWCGWVPDDDEPGLRVRKDWVIGWACVGSESFPVRVAPQTGRSIVVGPALDPDRDALLAVLTAGESWQELPGMDERIRAKILQGVTGHVQENQD